MQLAFPGLEPPVRPSWTSLYADDGSAMARTYLYLGIDTPTDEKLLSRPVLERHLWTCLLCLAKHAQVDTGDPTIRGHDAKIIAGRFNLGAFRAVQAGLDYFAAANPRPMIEVDKDGSIHILNFIEWQGEYNAEVVRQADRERKRKSRQSRRDTKDNPEESQSDSSDKSQMSRPLAVAVTVAVDHVVSSKGEESEERDIHIVDNSSSKAPATEGNPDFSQAVKSAHAAALKRGAP